MAAGGEAGPQHGRTLRRPCSWAQAQRRYTRCGRPWTICHSKWDRWLFARGPTSWTSCAALTGTADAHNDVTDGHLSRNPLELIEKFGVKWSSTPFGAGDVIIFGMYFLHGSLDNVSQPLPPQHRQPLPAGLRAGRRAPHGTTSRPDSQGRKPQGLWPRCAKSGESETAWTEINNFSYRDSIPPWTVPEPKSRSEQRGHSTEDRRHFARRAAGRPGTTPTFLPTTRSRSCTSGPTDSCFWTISFSIILTASRGSCARRRRPPKPLLSFTDLPWEQVQFNPGTAGVVHESRRRAVQDVVLAGPGGRTFQHQPGALLRRIRGRPPLGETRCRDDCIPFQGHTATNIVHPDVSQSGLALNHDRSDRERKYLLVNWPPKTAAKRPPGQPPPLQRRRLARRHSLADDQRREPACPIIMSRR